MNFAIMRFKACLMVLKVLWSCTISLQEERATVYIQFLDEKIEIASAKFHSTAMLESLRLSRGFELLGTFDDTPSWKMTK